MPLRTVRNLDARIRQHEATAIRKVEGACELLQRRLGSPALATPIREDPRRRRMFDLAASDVTDALRDLLRAASFEVTISLQKDLRAIAAHTGRRDLARDVLGSDGRRNVILGEWLASVRDETLAVFQKARDEVDRQWLLHLQYDRAKVIVSWCRTHNVKDGPRHVRDSSCVIERRLVAGDRIKEKWVKRLHNGGQSNLMGRSGMGVLRTLPGIMGNVAVNHLYGYVNDARIDSMGYAEEILR